MEEEWGPSALSAPASVSRCRSLLQSLRRHVLSGYHAVPSFVALQLMEQLDLELRGLGKRRGERGGSLSPVGVAGGGEVAASGLAFSRHGETTAASTGTAPAPHPCEHCERARSKIRSLRSERDELKGRFVSLQAGGSGGGDMGTGFDSAAAQQKYPLLLAEYRRVISKLSSKLLAKADSRDRTQTSFFSNGSAKLEAELARLALEAKASNVAREEAEVQAMASEARCLRMERILRDVLLERETWEDRFHQERATCSALRLALGSIKGKSSRTKGHGKLKSDSPVRLDEGEGIGKSTATEEVDLKIAELTAALRRAACSESRRIVEDAASRVRHHSSVPEESPTSAEKTLDVGPSPQGSTGGVTEMDFER